MRGSEKGIWLCGSTVGFDTLLGTRFNRVLKANPHPPCAQVRLWVISPKDHANVTCAVLRATIRLYLHKLSVSGYHEQDTIGNCFSCCFQGVTAVVKELCAWFPMVDYHNGGMLLAVGRAPETGSSGRLQGSGPGSSFGGAEGYGDLVAVYDMSTGLKTRALHFRYRPQTHAPLSGFRNVSLLVFQG